MLNNTKKLINQLNELMNLCMAEIKFTDIAEMDKNTMEAIRISSQLYKTSCELAVKQAEMIESLDKKTNELLEINEKLLAKSNKGMA